MCVYSCTSNPYAHGESNLSLGQGNLEDIHVLIKDICWRLCFKEEGNTLSQGGAGGSNCV